MDTGLAGFPTSQRAPEADCNRSHARAAIRPEKLKIADEKLRPRNFPSVGRGPLSCENRCNSLLHGAYMPRMLPTSTDTYLELSGGSISILNIWHYHPQYGSIPTLRKLSLRRQSHSGLRRRRGRTGGRPLLHRRGFLAHLAQECRHGEQWSRLLESRSRLHEVFTAGFWNVAAFCAAWCYNLIKKEWDENV